MRLFNSIFCCIVLLFFTMVAIAQPRYTSVNKQAIKSYEAATGFYDTHQNTKAEAELLKAISKDERFVEAYILLANVYVDMGDLEKAVDQYHRAIEVNPNFYPNNYYTMANIELNIGRYADALNHYEKFISFPSVNSAFSEKAALKVASCKFALEAMKNPVPFSPANLGEAINSPFDEYFPSITIDDATMIYTRNRPMSEGSPYFHEDFYISRRVNGEWSKSFNGGPQLNTAGNEGVPNFSVDGRLVFFAACERPDSKGSCDIYYSRLKGDQWSKPVNLGGPVNTGVWESQPSFSSDGRTLYFIRGVITGYGIKEQDIYTSKVNDEGRWSEPVKLPSNINTPGEEEFVFIHPDDQTLYFSSDGHVGMGNLDIYVSRRLPDGKWGDPMNLGYPINTFRDERGLLVGPKGNVAYIASDREGGLGGLDLYSFELYQAVRPQLVTYVKGIVTDSKTGVPLQANFEIIDIESGKTIVSAFTEKQDGDFLASLTAGKDYMLNVSKNGYLFFSDHFNCTDAADVKNPFLIKVPLEPADAGSKVVLKNVFFDTNKYELQPESYTELGKLIRFLDANPKVRVEISGHTDNTGEKAKNKMLSDNRAKTVYEYLVSKGVLPSRMTYKGYGDEKPVDTNDTPEGRANNRRTECTILSVQ